MLTWLVSMSSAISCGSPVSGRSATSSSTKALNGEPTLTNSVTMLAAISRQARSVITVTFSSGLIRRHVLTALKAPGESSGSNVEVVRSVSNGGVKCVLSGDSKRSGELLDRRGRIENPNLGFFYDIVHD